MEDVTRSALAGDEDPAARYEHRTQRPEIPVAGVVGGPGGGSERTKERERGRKLENRVAAVVCAGRSAVADRDVDVARGVDDRPAGGPYRTFAGHRDAVRDGGARTARRNAHYFTHVLAAVAGQSAEADIDVSVGHGQRRTLLVGSRIVAGQVHNARPSNHACGGIEGKENVLEPGDFGHGEERARD